MRVALITAATSSQWIMMTSLVLFFLTYVNEFRCVTIKPDVKVIVKDTEGEIANPA